MDILQNNKTGLFLDLLEQFHIYAITKFDMHLNDICSDRDNPIFLVLLAHTSQVAVRHTVCPRDRRQ